MENYPESGHSSPLSREIEFDNSSSWEDQPPQNYKVKFMCSYGGKIHPRHHDNQLSYIGGETKILALDRTVKFTALLAKLIALCDCDAISFKYQLPGEDLDALISVTDDDDLEHMMHEYDRLYRISPKQTRMRIFVFLNHTPTINSSDRTRSEEGKTDKELFVDALNSAPQLQTPVNSVDFLFGFEKANAMAAAPPAHQPIVERVQEVEDPVGLDERVIGSDPIQKHIQNLQLMRIEEQQGMYRRRSDDSLSAGGEYSKQPEKMPQVPLPGGIPFLSGVYPASNISKEQQQQVYMVPAPACAYPTPTQMMRPANGPPTQGYYAVQRVPVEVYRDQQAMYNMIAQGAAPTMAASIQTMAQQKAGGYSGMVRPGITGGVGMVAENGYAPVAYDSGAGRQMVYSAPGGVMGQPAQYQGMASDMRPAGEAGGKAAAKATQASV